MVINQSESKLALEWLKDYCQDNPEKGFVLISFAAFLFSPFLTNDGVCLLFVEPLLKLFKSDGDPKSKLHRSDAIYFLISLACSSNIGSALTYTGNPQVLKCNEVNLNYTNRT